MFLLVLLLDMRPEQLLLLLVAAALAPSKALRLGPSVRTHARTAYRAVRPTCAAEGAVADVMTPVGSAVVLDPEMTLSEAANMLNERSITGAPVVEEGKLIGVMRSAACLSGSLPLAA